MWRRQCRNSGNVRGLWPQRSGTGSESKAGHGVKMTPPPPPPSLFQLLEQRAFVDQQTDVGLHSRGCIMKWTGGPTDLYKMYIGPGVGHIVQELCESRGGRPGLSVLTSLLVSVDVKNY